MEVKYREYEIYTVISPEGELNTCVRKIEALYDADGKWVKDLGDVQVIDVSSEEVSNLIGTRAKLAAEASGIKIEYARLAKEADELRNQVAKLEKQVTTRVDQAAENAVLRNEIQKLEKKLAWEAKK